MEDQPLEPPASPLEQSKSPFEPVAGPPVADSSLADVPAAGSPAGSLAAESPAAESPADLWPRRPSVPNYRILRQLGAGAMGEVYLAEQQRPFRRQVAIKVIRLGRATHDVVARFESERQALALMNHPNIAAVFDAGETAQGRPFFAMEMVDGESITEYCDRHRCTPSQRLELFLQVCEGVQHAHQKGVIHRDLKPSNVLVTVLDDKPVPKIIDFGLVKAVAQPLSENATSTVLGAIVGTPVYMSPEQVEVSGLDIDTRSDVYCLGVLLYELLVGVVPFGGVAAIQLKIGDSAAPRPSVRVASLGAPGQAIGSNRRTELKSLARQLQGDLDCIILKTIERDRGRRYATANALAVDIRRHLANEPVVASPPSNIYRARKFVRRHRLAVAATVMVLIALLSGVVGATVGLARAVRAERRASAEAETARQVSDFMVDLFRLSNPEQAQGETITARAILDQGARRIRRELDGQPLTKARLLDTIGGVYRNLGLFDQAAVLIEEALEIRRNLLASDSLELAESRQSLGHLYSLQGRYGEAQTLIEQALTVREGALGPDDARVADSLATLGRGLASQGQHDQAEPRLRRVLAIRRRTLGPDHPDVADSLNALAVFYWRRGSYAESERLYKEALAIYQQVLEPGDFRLRRTLNDLAVLYKDLNRLGEAEEMHRRSLEIKERVLGPDHVEVASTLNNLALIYDSQKRYAEAEALFRRALEILIESFGEEHDRTALAVANVAWILYQQGQYEEAEAFYRRARGIYAMTVGESHSNVAILLSDQAKMYVDQRRFEEAQGLLERSMTIRRQALGADHPRVADCLHDLAELFEMRELHGEAESFYRRALAIRRAKLEPDHPAVAETLDALAELLRRSGRQAEARELSTAGRRPDS